ncbi:hypothetical protein BHYA_0420g00010 [Botrytis hyacinthi]|uniref:Uncharacterized protein n=1 Tax=Botrytis hyacinthi TaxID=278943 RepID=A0A4Z1G8I8_9HELO|nr:hypothetical protein BHYA_0420g00010 [Botrytis hyacinthi]
MSTLHEKRLSSHELIVVSTIGNTRTNRSRTPYFTFGSFVTPFAQIRGEKEKEEVIINVECGPKLGLRRCTKMGTKTGVGRALHIDFPRESNRRRKEKLKRREEKGIASKVRYRS